MKLNATMRLFIISLHVIILVSLSGCNNSVGTNSQNNSYAPASTETDISKIENDSALDATDQNNPLEPGFTYEEIVENINILKNNEEFILYSVDSSIKQVTYDLLNWETPNTITKLDINNDAVAEQVQIGLDNPNGTRVYVENSGIMNNLLNITSRFKEGIFSAYGELDLNTRIELSFIDINNDDISECFLAIRNDDHVEIKVLKQLQEIDSLYSFIEIGSMTSHKYVWLDAEKKLWSLDFKENLAQSHEYKADTGLFEISSQDSKCFMSKSIINVYGEEKNYYEYRINLISGSKELEDFIESNTWSYENEILVKLFFDNGSIFIGDTGIWTEYKFDSVNIDLENLLVTYHVFQSSSETDTEAPSTITDTDYLLQLELSNVTNSLELSKFSTETEEGEIQTAEFHLET